MSVLKWDICCRGLVLVLAMAAPLTALAKMPPRQAPTIEAVCKLQAATPEVLHLKILTVSRVDYRRPAPAPGATGGSPGSYRTTYTSEVLSVRRSETGLVAGQKLALSDVGTLDRQFLRTLKVGEVVESVFLRRTSGNGPRFYEFAALDGSLLAATTKQCDNAKYSFEAWPSDPALR